MIPGVDAGLVSVLVPDRGIEVDEAARECEGVGVGVVDPDEEAEGFVVEYGSWGFTDPGSTPRRNRIWTAMLGGRDGRGVMRLRRAGGRPVLRNKREGSIIPCKVEDWRKLYKAT